MVWDFIFKIFFGRKIKRITVNDQKFQDIRNTAEDLKQIKRN